ncbi:MAG: potassium-transporting ATPase subunit KdpA [Chloroflexi bacterium]|nr:potassium-transporting ATPase subunit KdpA [Chloroflexota bacterium]
MPGGSQWLAPVDRQAAACVWEGVGVLLNAIVQIVFFLLLLLLVTKPLGLYMARVYQGERTWLDPALRPVERLIYRVTGVEAGTEMRWATYAVAALLFSLFGLLLTYALQRLQGLLPFNPQVLGAVSEDSSFNTAASFTTNTNWQGYAGETTMSYLTQMVGLATHNFTSAAVGMAVAVAFIRGLSRRSTHAIGNFWVDLTRGALWVLLPISLAGALLLVSQGVIQNVSPYVTVTTLEGASQTLAMGPVASQEIIKHLGTNGGGFFNANAAHPFESPNPLTNLVHMLSILAIAAGLTYTFGRLVGDTRQGWAVLLAMFLIFAAGIALAVTMEQSGNPLVRALGVNDTPAEGALAQAGGNMEGKEVRFGVINAALFAAVTTAASCGAVNAMHDSFTGLGGLVPMFLIQLGEVIFGGVGSGLYVMLVFAIVAVFIAGLMIGRTPEYLGKKIGPFEMKMATLVILIPPLFILGLTGLASVLPVGTATLNNPGAHGFSEILYAYTSQTGNNGSAFAGLGANNPFYNVTGGIAMLAGRFPPMVALLALAGALAAKKQTPVSVGTLPTHTPLFTGLLVGVVLIVGGLTFFPALVLGPIVDHLQMAAGKIVGG